MKKTINATTPAQQTRPLTLPEEMDFARYRFSQMTEQLVKFDVQDFTQRPEPNKDMPFILHDDNLPKFGRQLLTQAQMREACESIYKKVRHVNWLNQNARLTAEISFLDFSLQCGGDTFYLSDTVVCYRGIGEEKTIGCGFMECYRMDVHVLIGEYNGETHAFLEVERENGEYHIVELSEFGLTSTFEVDGHNLGIVMLFDNQHDIEKFMVMPNSPREKHWTRTDISADAVPPQNCGSYVIGGSSYIRPDGSTEDSTR